MYSIAECTFAETHEVSMQCVDRLKHSFCSEYPFVMDISLGESDYYHMHMDAIAIAGVGHPETIDTYQSDDHRWGIYHPGLTTMFEPNKVGLQARFVIGFKLKSEASLFKLCWFKI